MAGLQSGEGRMTIDSDVCAQYINVTDTKTATGKAAQRTVLGVKNGFFSHDICESEYTVGLLKCTEQCIYCMPEKNNKRPK